MIPVPHSVMNNYVAILGSREIPPAHVEHYKKWLRYFYDFYANYLKMDDKSEKIKLFLEKLRSKKQTQAQCQQAAHAISLYFEMQSQERQQEKSVDGPSCEPQQITEQETALQVFNESFAPSAPLRYSHHSDAARALQSENDHDLHPLCACQNGERTEKSAGFLNLILASVVLG